MLEIFSFEFMRYALITGFFTAISGAMLGNFVVAARQSIISDMLAHTALVGVGLGIFWDVSPTYLAFIATIFSSLLLWKLNKKQNSAPEAYSMLLLTGGLAIALLFAHLNKNNPVSLDSYLFGSILTVTETELYNFLILNIIIIGVIIFLWKPLLTLVFDREYLQVHSRKNMYEIIFMLLISCMVAIGLKAIGGLLIGGLLVIPTLIVQPFSKSFFQNVWMSVIVSVCSVVTGIISSFYFDIPTSSSVIMALIIGFCFSRAIYYVGYKR